MPTIGFRPRFTFRLPEQSDHVEMLIRQQLRRNNPSDLKLRKESNGLVLRFPSHLSRIWTPQVSMMMHVEAQGTMVRGIIGPSYRIWRFFRWALLVFALMILAGLLLALIYNGSGSGTWGFYVLMLGLAGGLFVYFLSEEVKRRARDEADLLKAFLEGALDRELFPRKRRPVDMSVPRPAANIR